MLVEVITRQADDRDMDTLRRFLTKRTRDGSGRQCDRGCLSLRQLVEVIDVPSSDNHAMGRDRASGYLRWRKMKDDRMVILPEQATWKRDLASHLPTDSRCSLAVDPTKPSPSARG